MRSKHLRWLTPGTNTGYTGGCNLGASHSTSEFVAFLNSDAVVAPDALAHLVDALNDPGVGIATALVLLYDEPAVVNSAGNPVHYSLLSWAGGWGDPASEHEEHNGARERQRRAHDDAQRLSSMSSGVSTRSCSPTVRTST